MGIGSISGCCKKKQTRISAATLNNIDIKPTVTPNGFARLYAGARTNENQYTCPVLAVHRWNKSGQQTLTQHGDIGTVQQSGGGFFERDRSSTMLTQAGQHDEMKMGVDEDIQIIPIEDIISIKVSSEIRKAVKQSMIRRIKTPPPEDHLTCGQKVNKCCMKNVFCCCHKERRVVPQEVTNMKVAKGATRFILVTIEHLRHVLVHTPSNVRVLSQDKQAEFYQKHLYEEPLKFYYLHNDIFDEAEYNIKLKESEALARLVYQIKAMGAGHYPDTPQLEQLIKQTELHLFGYDPVKANITNIEGTSEVTSAVVVRHTTQGD